MDLYDKLMLKKRGMIESVGYILKEHLNFEHTRHRSMCGFFLNIFSTLTAYQIRKKKPSIATKFVQDLLTA
jgi:Transposase DDE domain